MQKHARFAVQAAFILVVLMMGGCGAPVAMNPSTSAPSATPVPAPSMTVIPAATAQAGATNAPEPAAMVLKEYDLGPATIEQMQQEGERRNLPYRIQGIIAVPAGTGKHPLVVITHGSHKGCPPKPTSGDLEIDTWPCPPAQEQRNDLGWRYLLEALAKQGYITVSLNMNAVNTAAWDGFGPTFERYAAVLDAHLAKLVAANQGVDQGFGLDLTGRIDLTRTALVGHSQGGGYAVIYASKRTDPTYTDLGGPLSGLLLVAPAIQLAQSDQSADPQPVSPPDIPTGIVMGLCDGDVSDLQGFTYYEQARSEPQRTHTMQVVMPYGANHNFFNATLGPDGLDPEGAPGCDRPAGRLSPAHQQAFLASYAQDFFVGVFGNAAPPAAWQASATAPQRLYGVPVLTALLLPTTQRQALMLFSGTSLPTDPSSGAVSASLPLQASVCSAQSGACDTATYAIPVAQSIRQPVIRLSWKQRGGALNISLPMQQRHFSRFASVQMRVVLDGFVQANNDGQALTIRLRDTNGKEVSVVLSAETYALQTPTTAVRDADKPQRYLQGSAPLAAIRVPLARFNSIDLTKVESLALLFDQSDQGALFVADLELLR